MSISETFEEEFIIGYSNKIDKNLKETLVDLNQCFERIALKFDLEINDVISIITKRKIKSMSPAKKDEYIMFNGKKHPRYFKDAPSINRDPDRFIKDISTEELQKFIDLASYLYFNYDGGGLTDNSFDALEYHLNKRLKQRQRQREKVGAPPVERIRTKLPIPMNSLIKYKPNTRELTDYVTSNKTLIATDKLDGVSCLLHVKNGKFHKMYTRGDGIIGGDISNLIPLININKNVKENKLEKEFNFFIRGELVIKKSTFDEKYSLDYSNPRSFVSSKVNTGHVTYGVQDIDLVCYQILQILSDDDEDRYAKLNMNPSKTLKFLKMLGFNVCDHILLTDVSIFKIIDLYKDRRQASIYPIDGLVLEPNEWIDPFSEKYNRVKIAFKMILEEQTRKTKVIDVEWNISRFGRFVPVVIYESVYIDGVRLHRATGHNAGYIRDNNIGVGTNITVIRSGDVIPHISDVKRDESINAIFPNIKDGDGKVYKYNWQNNDIVLDDIEGNDHVRLARIIHFFETIGVKRLGEKTLQKMYVYGLDTVKKITNSTASEFIKIKGIGKITSESHYLNIHETLRHTRIDRFIVASTTLKLGIGRKLAKKLLIQYPNILEDDEKEIKRHLKANKIPGIGVKRIDNISENIPIFKKFLYGLNKKDIEYAIEYEKKRIRDIKKNGYNLKIKDKVFVFTAFYGNKDLDLEDYIFDNLGDISSTVTSQTECLVSGNIYELNSTKMINAKKFNIKILTIPEFLIDYKISITFKKYDKEDKE